MSRMAYQNTFRGRVTAAAIKFYRRNPYYVLNVVMGSFCLGVYLLLLEHMTR